MKHLWDILFHTLAAKQKGSTFHAACITHEVQTKIPVKLFLTSFLLDEKKLTLQKELSFIFEYKCYVADTMLQPFISQT